MSKPKLTFVNLTPHSIHMPDGTVLPPSGILPRCEEVDHNVGTLEGMPLITRQFGKVHDMPAPHHGLFYIVSMVTRQALPDRIDIASPGTLVRDENGNIIGCKNLVVNSLPKAFSMFDGKAEADNALPDN